MRARLPNCDAARCVSSASRASEAPVPVFTKASDPVLEEEDLSWCTWAMEGDCFGVSDSGRAVPFGFEARCRGRVVPAFAHVAERHVGG